MPNKTFPEIAAEMRQEAEQQSKASRRLSRGLELSLYRSVLPDGVLRTLVLMRDDVPPSETEIETVRRDFGIPPTAEILATNRVVSLTWLELKPIEQVPLLEVAA